MNWIALAEIALAVMVTQMDLFNRQLDTTPLTAGQFLLALSAAVLLFVLWELGKLIARRRISATESNSPGSSSASPASGESNVKRPLDSARTVKGPPSRDPQHQALNHGCASLPATGAKLPALSEDSVEPERFSVPSTSTHLRSTQQRFRKRAALPTSAGRKRRSCPAPCRSSSRPRPKPERRPQRPPVRGWRFGRVGFPRAAARRAPRRGFRPPYLSR
jgi:hypothetical protein